MLEKIVTRRWYLQKHLDAPLLKEREEFLELKMSEGKGHNYLLTLADYLLLIVNMLKMADGGMRIIKISEIEDAAALWANTLKNHHMKRKPTPSARSKFMNIAFSWLSYIGLLDETYMDKKSVINRLFSRKAYKLHYLTYPMIEERSAHLLHWEKAGASVCTLRQIAAYHTHAIDLLHLEDGRMVTDDELRRAADCWSGMEKPGRLKSDGNCARQNFLSHVIDWLTFMGRYARTEDEFPLKMQVDEYLNWLKDGKGCSPNTVYSRYSILKNFMLAITPETQESITPQMLDSFIASRKEAGCTRRTIANTSSVLRDFFSYGQTRGWNTGLPVKALRSPRIYGHEDVPSFVPWDTIRKILSDKSSGQGTAIRDYAILLMLSVYGLRCSEVTGMLLDDIDWRSERFFLRRAKGCRPQIMPMLPIVGDAIIKYIREVRFNGGTCRNLFISTRAPHGRLSGSAVYKVARDALKAHNITIRHYGPHSFRHGCATHLINTGYSLKEIADLLGHMRLDTTKIYAKVDMAALRGVADMEWEGLL